MLCGTFVLAGCDDGSVVLLEMSPPPADPRACYDLAPGWEKHAHEARKLGRLIPKTSVQLGRKAVAHLVLDVELMRVFVVCDGVVTMCAVELSRRQLRPVGTALEEKKAPLKGVASVCCGVVAGKHVLFAAVKRRVCLFRYTAETLSPLDEVEICNSAPHISLDSQAQAAAVRERKQEERLQVEDAQWRSDHVTTVAASSPLRCVVLPMTAPVFFPNCRNRSERCSAWLTHASARGTPRPFLSNTVALPCVRLTSLYLSFVQTHNVVSLSAIDTTCA